LVQRIVKAYERHQELTGIGRQLDLRLGEPSSEAPSPSPESLSPTAQPQGPEIPLN
jgi:hypothetical protein